MAQQVLAQKLAALAWLQGHSALVMWHWQVRPTAYFSERHALSGQLFAHTVLVSNWRACVNNPIVKYGWMTHFELVQYRAM